MNMNYANTCERSALEDRLRMMEAMRSSGGCADGGTASSVFISVGLMLTLAGIAIFAAQLLTQDFTGKYRGFTRQGTLTIDSEVRAIPQLGF